MLEPYEGKLSRTVLRGEGGSNTADLLDRPSDIEQREGRILRQKNQNKEVRIYRYVTKGTFDAYSWGLIENKQKFISQIMTSDIVPREFVDQDETAFGYAEVKAAAIGDPRIKEKIEIDNDIMRLRALKSNYDSQCHKLEDDVEVHLPDKIKKLENRIHAMNKDISVRDSILKEEHDFIIEIDGSRYSDKVQAGELILAKSKRTDNKEDKMIGYFRGFELIISNRIFDDTYLVLRGNVKHDCIMGGSPVGNITRLENLLSSFEQEVLQSSQKLDKYKKDLVQAKEALAKPFEHQDEFKKKLLRQQELNSVLGGDNEKEDKQAEQIKREHKLLQKVM